MTINTELLEALKGLLAVVKIAESDIQGKAHQYLQTSSGSMVFSADAVSNAESAIAAAESAVSEPEKVDQQTPFKNCRFRICDLPGQCRGEGRCHHPCVAAYGTPAAVEKWMTIESAPKDGTEVLLMVERRAGVPNKCLVGHYMAGGHCIEDHPPIEKGWYFWNGNQFDIASKPTHWMPLPPAPTGAKE
jgi:hypothetical protein